MLVGTETDSKQNGGACKVQHVVSGVDSEDVRRGSDEEQSDDAEQ